MMTLDEIRAALGDRNLIRVSEAVGLHYHTVRDVRNNPEANPSWTTIKALSDYLEGKPDAEGVKNE